MFKSVVRIALGIVAFYFAVFRPVQANIIAALATHNALQSQSRARLLDVASELDKCDTEILNSLGDIYVSINDGTMAAISYGQGIVCSPGNSLLRIKFGESLFMAGYNGIDNINDALKLEPHNPVYQNEINRITKLLLRSR